ncbi:MAG: 1-deoxy-D-xylulose-5-phosphate reductoisomerase, partial [Mycobacteriaceae bacterium]
TWEFEPLDDAVFPAVTLARAAGSTGGCLPAVFNAANEEAVAAFMAGNIGFPHIVQTVASVLEEADEYRRSPADVEEVLAAEGWARARSRELAALR